MYVLQKLGTYSECHNAWSIRPTCQSLGCDITAVGTHWYHSDWLWPHTERYTTAVFWPSALTGTARSRGQQCLPLQSHGRWHLLALQRKHVNPRLTSANTANWQQLLRIMLMIKSVGKQSDLVYSHAVTQCYIITIRSRVFTVTLSQLIRLSSLQT